MPRPVIGVCAAVEPASYGVWVGEPTVLLPVSYARSIQAGGGLAMMLPPDPAAAERPDELLDRLDALILGGGADIDPSSHDGRPHPEIRDTDPERDRFEIALATTALERDLPLLGICRGMQLLNVATGGALEQHLPERLGHERHRQVPGSWGEHEVRLQAGSLAARAAAGERLAVKSHHHQGVADLGDGVEVSGWSADPDDEDTIEAIELPDRSFALGVLWHPEEDPGSRVIPALVAAAG
ncbi:MAG TPA: gamma-glutamyl-gamma-aminobutyrate hydrolase family protein [Solirubrobacterales bacterium]|jgi:putative glutamine amidotransferase|nr:gamma-glutamyl-gamma-aminobutyrate hydrolase family protein [Solirubrobacterales bacterium]